MIKTSRILVRKLGYRDCDDYFEIFGNPAIAKYDDFDPIAPEDARSNIARIIKNYNHPANEQEFAVESREDKKVIGVLAILIEVDALFIGFHFNQKYHGRGLALETVAAFIPWVTKTYNLPIRAITDPANKASIKLLGKLGFHLEKKIVRRDQSRVVRELQYELGKPVTAIVEEQRAPRLRQKVRRVSR